MNVGDLVKVYNNGELQSVKILELLDTKTFLDVYNLDDVGKNNTFFANKILVHNRNLN